MLLSYRFLSSFWKAIYACWRMGGLPPAFISCCTTKVCLSFSPTTSWNSCKSCFRSSCWVASRPLTVFSFPRGGSCKTTNRECDLAGECYFLGRLTRYNYSPILTPPRHFDVWDDPFGDVVWACSLWCLCQL